MEVCVCFTEEPDDVNLKLVDALQRGELDNAMLFLNNDTEFILAAVTLVRYGDGYGQLNCEYQDQTYLLQSVKPQFFVEAGSMTDAYKKASEIDEHPFYAKLPVSWHEKREWPVVTRERLSDDEIME